MSAKPPRPEGKTRGPVIEEVWLYIAIDGEGREGVLTCLDMARNVTVPMMATDEARAEALRPAAEQRAKRLGQHVKLVRFHLRHDVEIFGP